MGPNPIPSESSVSLRMGWYCWWKKSCTTWDVFKEPVNDGMSYQPQLVSWISSNSIYFHCFAIFFGAYFLIHGFTTLSDPEMNENTWEFSWSDALTKRSSLSFEWVLFFFVAFWCALQLPWCLFERQSMILWTLPVTTGICIESNQGSQKSQKCGLQLWYELCIIGEQKIMGFVTHLLLPFIGLDVHKVWQSWVTFLLDCFFTVAEAIDLPIYW